MARIVCDGQQHQNTRAESSLPLKRTLPTRVVIYQVGSQENARHHERRNHEPLVHRDFTLAFRGVTRRQEYAAVPLRVAFNAA